MAYNKEHYRKQGAALFNAGLVIFFGAPRGWQHAARIKGYNKARDEWRSAHPQADEWDAMRKKNRAFCQSGIKKG